MGRAPCCDKAKVKKGPWSPEEDTKLKEFIEKSGTGGNWIALPHKAGLKRCGKSCRLRWLNYLRPNIKHGEFSDDEDRIICSLFASIGSRWSIIAAQLPGRTDNDIKNYWNTKLKKKLLGLSPSQRKPQQQQQQQQLFPSSFVDTIAPTSSSQGSCYIPQKLLLTGLESFTINTDALSSVATTSSLLQGPLHHYQMKGTGDLLMFGGEQSCSSSDGSCNQISYGKEIEYEHQMGLETLFYSSGVEDNQKLLLGGGGGGGGVCGGQLEMRNGLWVEAPLDYDYEDIKQLTNTNYNGFNHHLFMDDPSSAVRSMQLQNSRDERGHVLLQTVKSQDFFPFPFGSKVVVSDEDVDSTWVD